MPSTSASADISLRQARRIALAAQGFVPSRRGLRRPDRRHLDAVLEKIGVLQIDSINVLERSHYLPLFSRLGPYRKSLLEDAAYCARDKRRMFEYWGHEASLLPVETQPLLRWRMERARNNQGIYKGIAQFAKDNSDKVDALLTEITERGASGVSDVAKDESRNSPWWGWHDTKIGLEWLFWTGQITTAGRRNFERIYDLPERVLPDHVLNQATPDEADAQRALIAIAARAFGIATMADLRDYFRLPLADTKARIAEMVEDGALEPVNVDTWQHQAYLTPDAAMPARASPRALLSPFDSLIWERSRTERMFGFHFRLEIYVPEAKRQYGYYVLPFLMGDRLVARVDLKTDRKACVLRVQAAHGEPGIDRSKVTAALADELASMAAWLGMDRVEIHGRGDLAGDLQKVTTGSNGMALVAV